MWLKNSRGLLLSLSFTCIVNIAFFECSYLDKFEVLNETWQNYGHKKYLVMFRHSMNIISTVYVCKLTFLLYSCKLI